MTSPRPASPHAPGILAAVAAGGALGTALRHLLITVLPFGLSTLVANLAGCVFLGLVTGRIQSRGGRALLGSGLAGALTTFSGFVLEAVELSRGDLWTGFAYVTLSLAGGTAAAVWGLRLGASGGRP